MEEFLFSLFSSTRFTTNSVSKAFLPRRAGLGYRLVYDKINRDMIRPCLRARRKKVMAEEDPRASCEEPAGKSCMVKRKC
jgi:hypothetical protein